MKINFRNKKQVKKGFTLIELLVVVAIISLLSSIVMASLNSARGKAKDAAIKAAMSEVSNLMALNFSDYGSYCQIQPQAVWISAYVSCDAAFSSAITSGYKYAQKARDLCNNIYNNAAPPSWGGNGYKMLIYLSSGDCTNTYSWEALLNNGKWYCNGTSGKGEYPDENSGYYSHPGCYNTP